MAKESKGGRSAKGLKVGPIPLEFISRESAEEKADLISVLLFDVGGATLAVRVEQTEGVVDCPRITPLPSAPDRMAGIASVRGRITIVMDLSPRANQNGLKRRLILLKGEAQLGLLADHVEAVVALAPKKVRTPAVRKKPPPYEEAADDGVPAKSFFKSGGRDVPIIDVEALARM